MNTNRNLKLALALLFVIAATSITLNIVFFAYGQSYYQQLNETRLDPLGLGAYSTTPQTDDGSQQQHIVFFGDSRAFQWPAPAVDGYTFTNRGIGAQTSSQIAQRFKVHVAPLKPDIIVLQLCINDLKAIPIFPERKRAIIKSCKSNIIDIVLASRDLNATVILTTVIPLGQIPLERRMFWSPDVALAIDEINAHIFSLANEDVVIFDTASVLADEDGLVQPKYQFDFLHLNEAGYNALNEALVSLLNQLQ